MSNPKTMRNAFIRVSAKNNTNNGVVEYTLDDIKRIVEDFTLRYTDTKYALIEHNRDKSPDGAVAKHFHIFMKFYYPVQFKYIKEIFPYGNIQSGRSANACVQYLIHKNNSDKTQYNKAEIIRNFKDDEFDIMFIKSKSAIRKEETDELENILSNIAENKIKRFNVDEFVSVQISSKYKKQIDNAFKYRDLKLMKDPSRDIQVIFITGDSGNGKTVFAKKAFCADYDGICISSSSNDPLQEYADQDVLILDDLRDDDFKFQDLLKLLDPHTGSSVKSRFHNKMFMGKCIIITSYKRLEEWYGKVPSSAKKQLYRRISLYVEVEKDSIFIYEIDECFKKTLKAKMKNITSALVAKEPEKSIDTFINEAVNSYYKSLSGEVSEEEIQAGLSSVEYNPNLKETPEENLPF